MKIIFSAQWTWKKSIFFLACIKKNHRFLAKPYHAVYWNCYYSFFCGDYRLKFRYQQYHFWMLRFKYGLRNSDDWHDSAVGQLERPRCNYSPLTPAGIRKGYVQAPAECCHLGIRCCSPRCMDSFIWRPTQCTTHHFFFQSWRLKGGLSSFFKG